MSTAPQAAPQPGPTAATTARFRCACGRSVVAPADSVAAREGRCSRCRTRRQVGEAPLHRTDVE